MNPFFMLGAFFRQVRCPKCKRMQTVTARSAREGTRCRFCSATIPALKDPKK